MKLIFLVIVLSFVLWGIGDIFRGQGSGNVVAKVGGKSISRALFDRNVQRQSQQYREYLGEAFNDSMRQNVEAQVLQSMINDTLLDLETQRLGLSVSDKAIADAIRKNPAFQSEAGAFDKARYQNVLQSSGIIERDYVESLRREMASAILIKTLTSNPAVPSPMADMAYRFSHEKRNADVLRIPFNANAPVADPDAATIAAFHEKVAEQFQIPEYRAISYIVLGPEAVAKNVSVDDAALRQAYEENASEFAVPEKRAVSQIVLPDQAQADALYTALKAGKAVKDIPEAKTGFQALGDVAKGDLPAGAGDAVFALEKGAYSAPVKTDFGYHVFQVTGVIPGKTPGFDEVKEKLRQRLTDKQAEEALYALTTQIEDELGAGSTLEEIAKSLSLPLGQAGPLSEAGLDPAGKKVEGLPPFTTFVRLAFSTDAGDVSQLTEGGDNHYFVVRADNVTPSRQQTLDEVKDQVVKRWKDEQRHEALAKRADALAAEARKGTSLETLASREGLSISRVQAFDRNGKGAGDKDLLAPRFAGMLFRLRPGAASEAFADADGSYAIGVVRDAVVPDPAKDAQGREAAVSALEQEYYYELMSQYANYLQSRYSVKSYYTPTPAAPQ
ncbi:MAG: SurA N-terminal domain-containing protein [Alphaproteobacteria bacterium]|nr:SurA N-terminal domain-containing protein [Alphaproteobacteria bacterium]